MDYATQHEQKIKKNIFLNCLKAYKEFALQDRKPKRLYTIFLFHKITFTIPVKIILLTCFQLGFSYWEVEKRREASINEERLVPGTPVNSHSSTQQLHQRHDVRHILIYCLWSVRNKIFFNKILTQFQCFKTCVLQDTSKLSLQAGAASF